MDTKKLALKIMSRHGSNVVTLSETGSMNIQTNLWDQGEDSWELSELGKREVDLVVQLVKRKGWLRAKDASRGYWITKERLYDLLRDEKMTKTLITSTKFGL